MRGKSLALLVLALGCGLVASLGITQVLAKRGDQTPQGDMAQVFVAKADIPAGGVSSGENTKAEPWPKDKLPAGALLRQEDLDGRRAKYKIFAGQPIIEPMLLPRGEDGTSAEIPKGLRVVAINVTIEAIQGGLVLPGSRCDLQVFIRADPNLGIAETISKTILQDIRVFAVNDQTQDSMRSQDPKEPQQRSIPTGKTVSLLVTPAQSEIVTLANQLGTIRLILRSSEDKEQVKCEPLTPHEMLGLPTKSTRDKEKPPVDDTFNKWIKVVQDALKRSRENPAAAKAAEPARYVVRVRDALGFTDVQLIASTASSGLPGDEGAWTATNLPPQTHSDSSSTKTIEALPVLNPAGLPALKPPADAPLPFPKNTGKLPISG